MRYFMRELTTIEIQSIEGGADLFTASLFLAQNVVWGLTAYVGIREFKEVFLSYGMGGAIANGLSATVLGVPVGAVVGTLLGAACGYVGYSVITSI